jgi:hypothetical protein
VSLNNFLLSLLLCVFLLLLPDCIISSTEHWSKESTPCVQEKMSVSLVTVKENNFIQCVVIHMLQCIHVLIIFFFSLIGLGCTEQKLLCAIVLVISICLKF